MEKRAGGAPALVLIVVGPQGICGASHPPLWLLLTGFDLSSVLVGPVDFAEDCCKSSGLIQRLAAAGIRARLAEYQGASVDCDLVRVLLIGQPGTDNLGLEVGAQTTASSTGFERYGLHCFSSGQPHIVLPQSYHPCVFLLLCGTSGS